MSEWVFHGKAVKALKNIIEFFTAGAPTMQYSTVDPVSTPVNAPQGSLCWYSGELYVQSSAGTTNGWLAVVVKG